MTFANTVRLWSVDDLHQFREVLWRCVLALFNVESMMTSRAKTPQAELLQANAICEYAGKISQLVSEIERAKDDESGASAAMRKAKLKVQETAKEKLAEDEGQILWSYSAKLSTK